jgi:hypothetical protein
MRLALSAAFVAAAALAPLPAHAVNEPATLGFSVGYYDILKNTPHKPAADFRLEYRAAYDMLGLANASNSWIEIRPMAGFEATSDEAKYLFGGFVFDVPIGRHFVFSPNLAVGFYDNSKGKYLGSFVEFRSTVEVGYKFDNGLRLTTAFGHISNAGLTKQNHGVEILSAYVHVPVDMLFGR